jgi:predicted PurR-regulated permease PerM
MKDSWSLPTRYLTVIILLMGLVAIAWVAHDLFKPLVIAGLVAYILNPVVIFLTQHTRMSHRLAAIWCISLSWRCSSPFRPL